MVNQYNTTSDFESALAQSSNIDGETMIKGLREPVAEFLSYISGLESGRGDIVVLTSERHPPEPIGVILSTDDIRVLAEALDGFGVSHIADHELNGSELTVSFHFD